MPTSKIIYGTNGDDTIRGSSQDETFYGLDGNDYIIGGGGNDIFYISGTWAIWGIDTIVGGDGDDIFYGADLGACIITTGGGKDKIFIGSIFSYGFTITDFDPKSDLLIVNSKFPFNNGTSKSSLVTIGKSGAIPENTVFIKIMDEVSEPVTDSLLSNLLFNLDTSTVNFGEQIVLLIGTKSGVEIWSYAPNSIPKVQANELKYIGRLAGVKISELEDGVIQYKPDQIEPPIASQILGTAANDSISGTKANDSIFGDKGNDTIFGGEGDDTIDGGDGIDISAFSSRKSNYIITKLNNGSYTVRDWWGDEGSDTVIRVERLKFTDFYVALDLNFSDNAGQALLLIGAVLGRDLLTAKRPLIGTVIDLFDQGFTIDQLAGALMRLPIWAGTLTPSNSSADIATYLLTRVNGRAPTTLELDAATKSLDSEVQGMFLAKLALSQANINQVDLIGIANTGFQYPAGG